MSQQVEPFPPSLGHWSFFPNSLEEFPYPTYIPYLFATASEQPVFRCKRKHFLKILRKIEKIRPRYSRESSHGSPAFRASALTFRLPWHVLILSILAPYGLLSAFAFFKQRILYIYIRVSPRDRAIIFTYHVLSG